MDDEPAENISGGPAGSSFAGFAPGEAATLTEERVDRLGELHGQNPRG